MRFEVLFDYNMYKYIYVFSSDYSPDLGQVGRNIVLLRKVGIVQCY